MKDKRLWVKRSPIGHPFWRGRVFNICRDCDPFLVQWAEKRPVKRCRMCKRDFYGPRYFKVHGDDPLH